MKKNRMMRLASILLVCVLLTTSVISGTFAKYITTDQTVDTARVAKWGVVATVAGDLFGKTYLNVDENDAITAWSVNNGTVSNVDGKEFVVAPGTSNTTGLDLFITGVPEVATKVFFDAAEDENGKPYADAEIYLAAGSYGVMVEYKGTLTKDNAVNYYLKDGAGNFTKAPTLISNATYYELHDAVDATTYYPMVWSVDGVAVDDSLATGDLELVKKALAETFAKEFAPNEDNALVTNVTWAWDFGTARTADEENITDNDKMDTILGNMMAAQKGDSVTVVMLDGTTYKTVKYDEVEVESGSANNKVVALVNGEEIACLTVAFNVRLTVEQVD